MDKSFLSVYSETFIWIKGSKGLVYNSKNGKSIAFNNDSVKNLTSKLLNLDNLYCIEIDSKIIENKSEIDLVSKIIENQAGIVFCPSTEKKPLVLPPILNLQVEVDRIVKESGMESIVGEKIFDYLHEIFFFIIDREKLVELCIIDIEKILDSIKNSSINKIHICGDNILKHSNISSIIKTLLKYNVKKCIYLDIDNFYDACVLFGILDNQIELIIDISLSNNINESKLSHLLNNGRGYSILFRFTVHDANEYNKAERFIKKYKILRFEYKPIFEKNNITFFKDYIYLNNDDIKSIKLNKRAIFAHQALNTHDFGKLTIMPDGKVYANPHFPALGTIDDDIRELVYREMVNGTSWRRIRDMKPCCDCVYQWLCPSPSDYELAIGKPNLCHIKP